MSEGVPPLPETIRAFCRMIRELVVDFARRYPGDPAVDRIRKRVNAAIDLIPARVVEMAGQYLWKYREQIYARDDAFFLDPANFAGDIEEADREDADLVNLAIPKIFSTWGESPKAEQDWYLDRAIDLTDMYLDYETARQQ